MVIGSHQKVILWDLLDKLLKRSTSSIQLEGVHPFELPRFDSHLQHQCTGKVREDEEMKRKRRRRNSQGIEKSMHRHAGMGLREAERIFKNYENVESYNLDNVGRARKHMDIDVVSLISCFTVLTTS
ncbi:hypothetical protein HZH68_009675 [Vespula germanica]|uniref:Uncharacterized protein n=1 Tax=Vespula germanica TaxID=30212 RepID=A0A834N3P4_VESGE|nr:hypothetical protein HZH68_009675 [Vespula germanica]